MKAHLAFPALVLATVVALIFPAPVAAHQFTLRDLVLVHPWSRASAGQARTGVVYLTIRNLGDQADRLIGASTPQADHAELHQTSMTGSTMKMAPAGAIDIPAGQEVRLAPNGSHLMLMGLKAPLKKGESFPVTLEFERSGSIVIEVLVQGVADLEAVP